MLSTIETAVLQKFKDGLANDRLGHAYLIVGNPRGNAAALAEKIMQTIFCGQAAGRPCAECHNCRRVAKRIHPDALWVEPIKKSRGILVEQIEEVLRRAHQTTFEGGWKALVFVSAERMNNEAANKLLKTLEEPPPKSIFLLLSDQPEALLPTIISRCQRTVLPDCAAEPADSLGAAIIRIAAGAGQGALAERLLPALAMLKLLKEIRAQCESEVAAALAQNEMEGEDMEDIEAIGQARIEAEYREKRRQALRLLLLWQRDLLFCASGLADDLLFFRSAAEKIRAAAGRLTVAQAMHNLEIVEKMQAGLDQHLPENIVIEWAFLQLAAPPGK